eukprot:558348_1
MHYLKLTIPSKKQYTTEWKKYNTYEPQIRSFIDTNNPSVRTIKITANEVQTFVKKIKKLHASFTDWQHDFKTINKSPLLARQSITHSHNESNNQLVQFKKEQKRSFNKE